jgi:pantoate--beta-alanine ligase
MKIFFDKEELEKIIKIEKNLGFVPTMGCLHIGHISLIKQSLLMSKKTIVSIFINKLQFNSNKDFIKYPRTLKKDILLLKKLKVDYLFIPNNKQIFPKGKNKKIKINKFENELCGAFRPDHFKAVVDVVDRFIKIVKPKYIFFGKKDMQQLKIVENYINMHHKNTKVIGCKTIRDKNGVACSSRNILLTSKDKFIASKIYYFIYRNKKKIINKKISVLKLKNFFINIGVDHIDYVKILDINKIMKPYKKNKKYKIFIAYYLNKTRLIDNI